MKNKYFLLFLSIILISTELLFYYFKKETALIFTRIVLVMGLALYYFSKRKTNVDKIDVYFFFVFMMVFANQFILFYKEEVEIMHYIYFFSISKFIFYLPLLLSRRTILFLGKIPRIRIIHAIILLTYCFYFYGNVMQSGVREKFLIPNLIYTLLVALISIITTIRNTTKISFQLVLICVYLTLASDFITAYEISDVSKDLMYYFSRPIYLFSIYFLIEGVLEDRKFITIEKSPIF